MSKTSYQNDFAFAYGEDVSPKLARKVMRDVYKTVELEKGNERLREFKEFVNMMIRRNLNNTCSDYETIMAIDEKLLEGGEG